VDDFFKILLIFFINVINRDFACFLNYQLYAQFMDMFYCYSL
jgi:hypothetical protein